MASIGSSIDRRWRRAGFVAGELLLLVALPLLAYAGFSAVLDTTDGRVVDPELDPDQPGYEAFVESTPVLGILGRDAEGALSWAAVAALPSRVGGGALFLVPVSTLVPTLESRELTLAQLDAESGTEAAGRGLGEILGVGLTELAEVGDERLRQLLGPVSPLPVENPDDAGPFEAGELALEAADAGAFLAAAGRGESDLTRLVRHEAFWRAWLAAVGGSQDPDVVPGETASGLGRFVRGLASGLYTIDVPPMEAEEAADGSIRFRREPFGTMDLSEARIPFPIAARPGARPRVRVLDGVGADGLSQRAARDVVEAGGQVVVVGNADRFEAATTEVVYFEEGVAPAANAIADAFGVTAERRTGPNPDDRVDVTVVAGEDVALAYGLAARPTTNGDDPG